MVGSPNFVRFVYDGDGSAFGEKGPNGSALVEKVFLDYFKSQNLPIAPTEFDGRSRLLRIHQQRHPCRRSVYRRGRPQVGRRG